MVDVHVQNCEMYKMYKIHVHTNVQNFSMVDLTIIDLNFSKLVGSKTYVNVISGAIKCIPASK